MPASTINKFTFSNQPQALFTSLRQILNFVSANLPLNADAASINFKLKVIITELLSNAIKHVKNEETTIQVYIDNKIIRIEKTDVGAPFNPDNGSSEKAIGQKILLSQDFLHRMYAIIEKDSFIRFVSEENQVNGDAGDVDKLSEHFGLLIITKSADEFIYTFDAPSALNTFSVTVNLN